MAQKGFKVEPENLVKSAKTIEDKTVRYEGEVKKIYSEITNLTLSWKGQTSESFNKQLEAYHNDFDELAKTLRLYTQFLNDSAKRYSTVDSKLAQDAQRLKIGK